MAKETECDEPESEKNQIKIDAINSCESPLNNKTRFSLSFTSKQPKLKSDMNNVSSGSTSNDNSPSVNENLALPKKTVLGVLQAKKRLQAFSLMKQSTLPVSPLLKKNTKRQKILTVNEIVYDENGKETEETIVVKKPAKKGMYKDRSVLFSIVCITSVQ